MRRWYRSGAFPVHRHSLVQLVVDGGLVALAYMLAFELRFDNGIPRRYDLLRDETILWVVPLCIVVFAAFGLYQRLWTYVGQRDYEALLRAVIVSAILVVGGIAFLHPVQIEARNGVELAVGMPMGVVAMWCCSRSSSPPACASSRTSCSRAAPAAGRASARAGARS
jgi:FlaA1/EpsC-like NDP-sugar epimerase